MITSIKPRRKLRPTIYNYSVSEMDILLTEKEEAVMEALRKVNSDNVVTGAIRQAFIINTTDSKRELICVLLSQCDDNPSLMYQILGKDAYELLIKLKP